jgi:hypothetical protein
MRAPAIPLGLAAAMAAGALAAAPAPKPKPPPQKPHVVKQQQPVVKQNFRGRRPDEIYPWEGFEDCPLVVPCVGTLRNTR